MNRRRNVFGTAKIAPNSHLEHSDDSQLKHAPFELDGVLRQIVEKAVREVCDCRKYLLRAINVRTNHVHSVISAMCKPELVLTALKAYATRAMREAGMLSTNVKPWSRHGSTIYLWKERDIAEAVAYVLLGQGDDLFRTSDR